MGGGRGGSCSVPEYRSVLGLYITDQRHTAMPPKKKSKPPSWVASTAAPPKPKVPRVTVLNQITSNDLKGIFFTVEGIDQTHFDKLATKNFSSWEDVRITLGVPVEVIVRLQDKLADLPQVRGWIEKPGDFPEEFAGSPRCATSSLRCSRCFISS